MESTATKIVDLLIQELINRLGDVVQQAQEPAMERLQDTIRDEMMNRITAERDLALQRHVAAQNVAQNVIEDKCHKLEEWIMDRINRLESDLSDRLFDNIEYKMTERVLAILDMREVSRKIEDKIDLVLGERVESAIGDVNWKDDDNLRESLPEMLNGLTVSMTINCIE